MRKTLLTLILLVIVACAYSQNSKRWQLLPSGAIRWTVKGKAAHIDHIEMSGLRVSAIIHYGLSESGGLELKRKVVFPMLRTIPNDTHASLSVTFDDNSQLAITGNGALLDEKPERFEISDGELTISSTTQTPLSITRTLLPSVDKAALIEVIRLDNKGDAPAKISVQNNIPATHTDPAKGVYGSYDIQAELKGPDTCTIAPKGHYSFAIVYSGKKASEQAYNYAFDLEQQKRANFAKDVFKDLVLETPNDTLDRAFAMAKLRTTESIFDTKNGLMHGPGGGAYYAAIWANDQAEYADPFFPFLGNLDGNGSAMNSYRLFARYINPEYKPIPSSIIAEGGSFWNGAGDRGDMAMIAYGASRFALANGKEDAAKELWPLIKWCLEYLETQKTADDVIRSDHDELEGRFPAGKVNLSTNALAYGAYVSGADLEKALGQTQLANTYQQKGKALRTAIERYFGADVQGFKTYRYYDGNTKLRAWICLPLVMGISERKAETIKALFSDQLWTSNGILTESGSKTFWDRATLYAFRGLLANGATDRAMPYLNYYSAMRLLGEHVPYPVEAWPEGDQRHLAAESALYCRVITEGLFGITPTGFRGFTVSPWLPKGWSVMKLRNIKAFDSTFDIVVRRSGNTELVSATLPGGKILQKMWDGKAPLKFDLSN